MKPLQDLYDAFLNKMTEDEWLEWSDEEVKMDWLALFQSAVVYFKFPRVSFEYCGDYFIDEKITNTEIQIVATYMKCEWLSRTILSYENLRVMYDEADFSPGNLIDKLTNLLEKEREHALNLEKIYYRSVNGAPYPYRNLSG